MKSKKVTSLGFLATDDDLADEHSALLALRFSKQVALLISHVKQKFAVRKVNKVVKRRWYEC